MINHGIASIYLPSAGSPSSAYAGRGRGALAVGPGRGPVDPAGPAHSRTPCGPFARPAPEPPRCATPRRPAPGLQRLVFGTGPT